MRHRVQPILCAMLILTACFPKNYQVTSTATTSATMNSTQAETRTPSPATSVPIVKSWNKMKIPAGCHFSSVSPTLDWVIYTCGNKLWLTKTTVPSSATLIVQDDNLVATSWSPDGTEFAMGTSYLDQKHNYIAELWVSRPQRPSDKRLLYRGNFFCDLQIWSPTGKWMLVAGGGGKNSEAILVRTDGTGREENIAPIGLMLWTHAASWSPDGTRLAYASDEWETNPAEIRILDVSNGTTASFYTRTGDFLTPAWSPDGKAIAVLVQSYPRELVILETSTKHILTELALPAEWKGGRDLFWSPTSDRIVVPFDLLRREIGFVSLPNGEHSELSVGKFSMVLGWAKDGKSVVILGEEDDQEVIWLFPVK